MKQHRIGFNSVLTTQCKEHGGDKTQWISVLYQYSSDVSTGESTELLVLCFVVAEFIIDKGDPTVERNDKGFKQEDILVCKAIDIEGELV